MKIILFVVIAVFSFVGVNAQTSRTTQSLAVKVKVDERVELLSIVARLAEFDEYVNNDFKIYADDVDKYFGKYKQHPVVKLAVKLRAEKGVSFDAVASMAVHLNPDLTPKVPFTDKVPDARWGRENALEFTKLLKQFYKESDCKTFFQKHSEVYQTAEERLQKVINKVDFEWYKKFYGELPNGSFNLYIGLLNGGGNYGPKVVYPNKKEDLYAIIGTWQTDSQGLPEYQDSFLPTIIHEYNHSFINHLVYADENNLKASGEVVFKPVENDMRSQAYGNWQTMMLESLVRAAVIRYMFEHENKAYQDEIIIQKARGFVWMDELSVLLGTYENSRNLYPTFRSFMPLIIGYYADLAKRINDKTAEFSERQPKIIAIEEFKNESQDVSPNLTKLTIVFDQPLSGKGYSFNLGEKGQDHMPIEKVIGYNENYTKFTIQVKLKPDWDYEFIVTGLSFRTKNKYPLQNYVVRFKTKKL